MFSAPRYSFSSPSAHSAYGAADLVANSETFAEVVPLKWRVQSGRGRITAVTLFTDDETVTNANFLLYLFRASPSFAIGDNEVFALTSTRTLMGTVAMDCTTGAVVSTTDKVKRFTVTVPICFQCDIIYGLISTAAAYDRDGVELFEVTLEVEE